MKPRKTDAPEEPRAYLCACNRLNPYSAYALAQLTMGHAIYHRCDCGRRNLIDPDDGVTLGPPPSGGVDGLVN